jgi:iron-sulfur cluster insertion protein
MNDKNLKVTEAAKNRLKELISNRPDVLGIRIEIVGGGCSGFKYKFGYLTEIQETDLITDLGDMKIAIDDYSCTKLAGTELDYVTDESFGSKFEFNNPNTTSKCGCGKSIGF